LGFAQPDGGRGPPSPPPHLCASPPGGQSRSPPKIRKRGPKTLEVFYARFAYLFARMQLWEQSAKLPARAILCHPRRNGRSVAETVGDAIPDRIQQHLYPA